ncbi:ATP-dependent DNA helicase RecQ-like [Saccostrea echinata]|uniref:ATP-dependent DNA helicase RecQ-like n=1 Tax=Saccostrea echinata TaxID=191078 RepID=UPI002A829069|nr:ATP-dependent DNA helicase RecQ-like [Saccostrea echinata]
METYEAKVKEIFQINELKDFQRESLAALLKKRDVFLSIKTGGGENDDSIFRNEMQFIFTSPKSVLNGKWRDWVTNNSTIRLIAVDEAHTVLHWGESASEEDPFRRWYGRLGELRSLVECPVILMTATANSAARKALQRKFCMTDCLEIIENPDRNNIKLFLQCVKYNTPLENTFFFLILMLKEKRELCDRNLIFCPAIRTCSKLYTMFRIMFKENVKLIDHIEMYHSKTTDDVKQLVKEDMSKENGKIRILIATSAAGMGVNFKGVKYTINYGCPRDMDTFVQQYGRAGRDGGSAMSLLIYTKRDIKCIDDDMKLYVKNETIVAMRIYCLPIRVNLLWIGTCICVVIYVIRSVM